MNDNVLKEYNRVDAIFNKTFKAQETNKRVIGYIYDENCRIGATEIGDYWKACLEDDDECSIFHDLVSAKSTTEILRSAIVIQEQLLRQAREAIEYDE